MLNTAFAPWPSFTREEADAVADVLLSNRVNNWTGTICREFEREFAEWCNADHAIALANGTLAIDLAWAVLGLKPGDEVIVTPRSYVASASTVVMAGAKPVFADVDPDSQNITPETVAPLINERTRAIICVHLAGWPCEMDGFAELAKAHDLRIVEDCAQAHGALYRSRSVGALGDIGCWSFCQDKIVTTGGEGGMVTMNDPELWKAGWSLKEHGKSYDAVFNHNHPPGFRWLHEGIGSNWRLTEMQAEIGRIQLRRMPEWHAARTRNAETLQKAWAGIEALRIPQVPEHIEHAWYKFYAFVRPDSLKSGWDRDRIMNEVTARGVPCYSGSCPEIYLEKAFESRGLAPASRLPVARELGETSLMFLVHPTLSEDDIEKTCAVVKEVMAKAQR